MDEDQIIDIPGVGPIAFPSSMTKEQIDEAARKLYDEAAHMAAAAAHTNDPSMLPGHGKTKTARTEDFMPHDPSNIFTKRPDMSLTDGVVEGLGSVDALKGAVKQVGSVADPRNWPGVISGIATGSSEEVPVRRAIDSFKSGHPVEAAGHYLSAGVPFLGPMIDSAGTHLGTGNPEEMGRAIPEVASLAAMSPTARAAAGTVGSVAGGVVGDVARHPVTTAAVGAGAGYLEGGWPGAVRGAGGGGVIGVLNKIADNMRRAPEPEKSGPKAAAPKPQPKAPEPRSTKPHASVGDHTTAPSTETTMRSGAPMPQEPVPFVAHADAPPPVPRTRTGTGSAYPGDAPVGATRPNGDGFTVNVKAEPKAPTPQPSRTGTGFEGAGMPQEPVPFVMHVPNEPIRPTPPTRTGTGSTSAPPEGPTNPTGSGFSQTTEATPPKPPTPTPARTGTGAETEPVNGPTSPNGQGFKMNVKTPPKPPAAETAKAEPTKTTAPPSSAEASKAAEPPKTEPTTDRPPSKSKRRSQVQGLSEADIDSRAASRGVPRETIIAEEMAELRKRAERHMAHRKAANASPTEMLKELMKYREKFGPDFMKGTE